MFRKNVAPIRVSGGVFYSHSTPGSSNDITTYLGDVINTRLIFKYFLNDARGLAVNLEMVGLHGLPFRADGKAVNVPPANFSVSGSSRRFSIGSPSNGLALRSSRPLACCSRLLANMA